MKRLVRIFGAALLALTGGLTAVVVLAAALIPPARTPLDEDRLTSHGVLRSVAALRPMLLPAHRRRGSR